MASIRAVAQRRAEAIARLEAAESKIKERFGVKVEPQKVTNADPALAEVQRLENVALYLETVLVDPSLKTKTDAEVVTSETSVEENGESEAPRKPRRPKG